MTDIPTNADFVSEVRQRMNAMYRDIGRMVPGETLNLPMDVEWYNGRASAFIFTAPRGAHDSNMMQLVDILESHFDKAELKEGVDPETEAVTVRLQVNPQMPLKFLRTLDKVKVDVRFKANSRAVRDLYVVYGGTDRLETVETAGSGEQADLTFRGVNRTAITQIGGDLAKIFFDFFVHTETDKLRQRKNQSETGDDTLILDGRFFAMDYNFRDFQDWVVQKRDAAKAGRQR